MRRPYRQFFPVAALILSLSASLKPSTCKADPINPWQGASVSTTAAGQGDSDSGATASAHSAGNTTASSLGSFGQPLTIAYSGSATANASGSSSQLLTVTTSLTQGTTGVLTAPINPSNPASAAASWTNDSLTIQGPAGAALPSSVSLQFRVDVSPSASLQLGNGNNLAVQINGENHFLSSNGDGTITMQPPGGSNEQTTSQTGTFDIKLALHAGGVSDPFSVGLSSSQSVQSETIPVNLPPSSMSLSLTGITLPDGNPLSSEGYSATFASGLTLEPQAVPEPSTLAIWMSCAALALTISRRARTTRQFVLSPQDVSSHR